MKASPPGRYRLVTSMRRGSPDQTGARTVQKPVHLEPGKTATLCRLEGAGRIVRFWMTLPILGQGTVLKDAVLRIYWDGEDRPSVESPLGDFFGAAFGRPVQLVSERLVIAGGAYLCRFEMPFNRGAVVEIENGSAGRLRNLFFQIGFHEEPVRRADQATLHAQYHRENPTAEGRPFVVLRARGEGWLAGVKMDVQNRAWWLKPPLREIPIPRGFGLGVLEGWETIVVDGEEDDAVVGTGGEDYFSGGFYFSGGPFCTPTHGCTWRSFFTGRASAYRFHLDDPLHFDQSIDFAMDHGQENSMAADFCSVAYWYQIEPHEPFPELPTAGDRRVDLPWRNALQWAIVGVAAAGTLAAAVVGVVLVLN